MTTPKITEKLEDRNTANNDSLPGTRNEATKYDSVPMPDHDALLRRFWRPALQLPGACGYEAGANGQDHPVYPAQIRRIARRLRDGRALEALT